MTDENDGNIENNKDEERKKDFPCSHYGCSKGYSSKSSRSNHMKKCSHPKKSPRKKIKLRRRSTSVSIVLWFSNMQVPYIDIEVNAMLVD